MGEEVERSLLLALIYCCRHGLALFFFFDKLPIFSLPTGDSTFDRDRQRNPPFVFLLFFTNAIKNKNKKRS
jgi:hypothetical protein